MRIGTFAITAVWAFWLCFVPPALAESTRRQIELDGVWQIAEGNLEEIPATFDHRVPVPGLVDLAQPAFDRVGFADSERLRQAFWYRRTFRIDGPIPPVALLKINKAKYGIRVFLNGQLVGDHLPCFTPAVFDVRKFLRGEDQENELVIRVGAYRTSVPRSIPDGWDFEKYRYIPGIYDSVKLILSGTPHIVRVQAVPHIDTSSVEVVAWIGNAGPAKSVNLQATVFEDKTNKKVGSVTKVLPAIPTGTEQEVHVLIPIRDCQLWSPESPFLYRLHLSTEKDEISTRFGMRSFRFDPSTRRAYLNGKPYYLRGTNVCIFRFFEDDSRGNLPWQRDWVRRLHEKFRTMHWNAMRYCIGFPPEFWYDVADEVGFLIQDEFPIWYLTPGNSLGVSWPADLTADELEREFRAWMQEHWNHPCVVIWDAQNETISNGVTAEAIRRVRHLDFSDRPWDNGWEPPVAPTDMLEAHTYIFSRIWSQKAPKHNPILALEQVHTPWAYGGMQERYPNAIIINEYGWLWLTRDGKPTSLTRNIYDFLLGPNASVQERRQLYAYYLAAMTEYWRAHRRAAGVLHFCGLTYSRPGDKPRPEGGATSDHFIDLENLEFEPYFEKYVRDAFCPVGLMIDLWKESLPPRVPHSVKVVVINDVYEPWNGTVRLSLFCQNEKLWTESRQCTVPAMGRTEVAFKLETPAKPGQYRLLAELLYYEGQAVCSRRRFKIAAE